MTQLKQAQLKEILGGLSMSTQRNRAALLAGLLILALSPPALAADVDVANPPPSASDEAQLALLSPTAQGPIIARESLATETKASTATVNASQPTRSATNLSQIKRARAANAGGSYSHRPSAPPLILGVRF